MGGMIHREPVRDLLSLRESLDRLFEDTFARSFGRFGGAGRTEGCSWVPVDLYDTGDDIVVEAAFPGVSTDCLDISVLGTTMTVKCDRPYTTDEMKGRTYARREISDGCYYRQIDLPVSVNVDRAYASYEHGVVKIVLPKSEIAKPKSIKVGPTMVGQAKQAVQEVGHRIGIG